MVPNRELIVDQCPVCDKVFTNEYQQMHAWTLSPRSRMLMHLIMSHQENITVNLIGDPNDIGSYIIDIKTTRKEL